MPNEFNRITIRSKTMKTILTTIFAIALTVFAFNTNPVMAKGSAPEGTEECKSAGYEGSHGKNHELNTIHCYTGDVSKWVSVDIDELESPDQPGNEGAVADSGEEGSTSAAGANDQ